MQAPACANLFWRLSCYRRVCTCFCYRIDGHRLWRRLFGAVTNTLTDPRSIPTEPGSPITISSGASTLGNRGSARQPGRRRRHDRDVDEHGFRRSHLDSRWECMGFWSHRAPGAVLETLRNRRHVSIPLRDSSWYGRDGNRSLRTCSESPACIQSFSASARSTSRASACWSRLAPSSASGCFSGRLSVRELARRPSTRQWPETWRPRRSEAPVGRRAPARGPAA